MAKKNKKPASEGLKKIVMDDLQSDLSQFQNILQHTSTTAQPASSEDEETAQIPPEPPAEENEFPVGLENITSILNGIKKDEEGGGKTVVVQNNAPDRSKTHDIGSAASRSHAPATSASAYRTRSEETIPLKSAVKMTTSTKTSPGYSRPLTRSSANLAASVSDSQFLQAEHLRMAQERILELEREVDHLRQENDLIVQGAREKAEEKEKLDRKMLEIERNAVERITRAEADANINRSHYEEARRELDKAQRKIRDLESRLAHDMTKVKKSERDLINRLELARVEKEALVRTKNDTILELKDKLDELQSKLEKEQFRASELNQKIENQNDQLSRTVRALRLALTHLESSDPNSTLVPIKKAE